MMNSLQKLWRVNKTERERTKRKEQIAGTGAFCLAWLLVVLATGVNCHMVRFKWSFMRPLLF